MRTKPALSSCLHCRLVAHSFFGVTALTRSCHSSFRICLTSMSSARQERALGIDYSSRFTSNGSFPTTNAKLCSSTARPLQIVSGAKHSACPALWLQRAFTILPRVLLCTRKAKSWQCRHMRSSFGSKRITRRVSIGLRTSSPARSAVVCTPATQWHVEHGLLGASRDRLCSALSTILEVRIALLKLYYFWVLFYHVGGPMIVPVFEAFTPELHVQSAFPLGHSTLGLLPPWRSAPGRHSSLG